MRFEDLLILYFGTSVFGYSIVRGALKEVLRLSVGRKNNYREVINRQSLLRRITLSYVKENINKHLVLYKVLQSAYYIYLSITLLLLILILLFMLQVKVFQTLWIITIIKIVLIDIPAVIFFVFNTGHDKKHGGVMWKI